MHVLIAGLVVHTVPAAAARVAARLRTETGLEVQGDDGDRRLATVLESESAEALERRIDELLAADEEIVGIFPTYVGEDDALPSDGTLHR